MRRIATVYQVVIIDGELVHESWCIEEGAAQRRIDNAVTLGKRGYWERRNIELTKEGVCLALELYPVRGLHNPRQKG